MALRVRLSMKANHRATQEALVGVAPSVLRALDHEVRGSPLGSREEEPGPARVHQPMVLLKEPDRLSPALYSALLRQETLPEVLLLFSGDGRTGDTDAEFMRVRLIDATVASLRLRKLDPEQHKDRQVLDLEELTLRYQAIEWSWPNGMMLRDDQRERT